MTSNTIIDLATARRTRGRPSAPAGLRPAIERGRPTGMLGHRWVHLPSRWRGVARDLRMRTLSWEVWLEAHDGRGYWLPAHQCEMDGNAA